MIDDDLCTSFHFKKITSKDYVQQYQDGTAVMHFCLLVRHNSRFDPNSIFVLKIRVICNNITEPNKLYFLNFESINSTASARYGTEQRQMLSTKFSCIDCFLLELNASSYSL